MSGRTVMRWISIATVVAAAAIAATLPAAASARSFTVQETQLTAAEQAQRVVALDRVAEYDLRICISERRTRCFAPLSYTGWTTLSASAYAYRWNVFGWANAQLTAGYVYVQPFGGEYRWAWTQRSGWVALHFNSALLTA